MGNAPATAPRTLAEDVDHLALGHTLLPTLTPREHGLPRHTSNDASKHPAITRAQIRWLQCGRGEHYEY